MQRQVYFVYLSYILSSVWFEIGFGLHGHNMGTSEMSNLVLTLHLITVNIQLHLRFLIVTFAKLYVKMQLKFFFFFSKSVVFKSWQESLPFKTCQISNSERDPL